jgi:CheY-like chemotaxis protein
MDLQMPRLDGFAATRLIRHAEPPGVRVPIIALTASAVAGEQERCLAAGMTGFLAKPVGIDALGRVLREQLRSQESGSTVESALPTAPSAEPAVPGERRLVGPTLDTGRLDELAEMGVDALPLIERAIDNFVGAAPGNVEDLRAAITLGDAQALRSAAHRLKGSAANLGAVRVAELALELEQRAHEGALDGADRYVDELAAELDAASAALTGYQLSGEPRSA